MGVRVPLEAHRCVDMKYSQLKKGEDFIGITIVFFCHDGKGNFVMAKRTANTRDEHGNWDIGGGSLEFGEMVEDTLKREIKEEYCTDVINFEFLGYRDVHRINNGKKTHWVALDFMVEIDPTKISNGEPHKCEEVKWFTLDKLPENVHSQFPIFLKLHQKKLVS